MNSHKTFIKTKVTVQIDDRYVKVSLLITDQLQLTMNEVSVVKVWFVIALIEESLMHLERKRLRVVALCEIVCN